MPLNTWEDVAVRIDNHSGTCMFFFVKELPDTARLVGGYGLTNCPLFSLGTFVFLSNTFKADLVVQVYCV